MARLIAAAIMIGLLFALTAGAQQGTTKKPPLGTWYRNKDNTVVRFEIKADVVRYTSEGPLGRLELDADYGVSSDSKFLFARIRAVKEGTGIATGELLSFGYSVKGESMTITDWKGTGGAAFASFLQGDYKKTSVSK